MQQVIGGEDMLTLLIIADDFTGALDTGVQFARSGAVTRVVTDNYYDYSQLDESVQVLVVDAETRHMTEQEAYETVYHLTKKAIRSGITYIYKKTDSALRGNVGSELTALLDASGRSMLSFVPAFPKMGRTTKEGIHYIEGIPVEKSVFGKDPYEPVKYSYIPDLIHEQSSVAVRVMEYTDRNNEADKSKEIRVWDTSEDYELEKIGKQLYESDGLRIMAGCAGFAAVLPKLLNLEGKNMPIPEFMPGFLVVCGSVNPITVGQLEYARGNGFTRINMTPEQKLDKDYWKTKEGKSFLARIETQIKYNPYCILDSNDEGEGNATKQYAKAYGIGEEEIRTWIAWSLGYMVKTLMDKGVNTTMMFTGGDTLLGCMKQLGVCVMEPICEVAPGIVLSKFKRNGGSYQVISKSGGFGGEQLLVELAKQYLSYDMKEEEESVNGL